MSKTPKLEQFLGARKTAFTLDVTKPKIFDLIHKGELKAIRVGRKYCIFVSSIHDYIDRHRYEPDLDSEDQAAARQVAAAAEDQEAREAKAAKDDDEDEAEEEDEAA